MAEAACAELQRLEEKYSFSLGDTGLASPSPYLKGQQLCLTSLPTQSLLLDLWPYSRLLLLPDCSQGSSLRSCTLGQEGGTG